MSPSPDTAGNKPILSLTGLGPTTSTSSSSSSSTTTSSAATTTTTTSSGGTGAGSEGGAVVPAAEGGAGDAPAGPAQKDDACRTADLLMTVSLVRGTIERVRPVHARLMRDNWIYLLLFVWAATVYKAVVSFVTFPVVNLQVAQFIDGCVAQIVSKIIDRYPSLKAQSDGGLLIPVARFLHKSSGSGFVRSFVAGLLLLAAKAFTVLLRVVSFFMNVWAGVFRRIKSFLNDDRDMTEVPVDELPLLFFKKLLGVFWAFPFNTVYNWLASPLVIQPAEWVGEIVRHLQELVSGACVGAGAAPQSSPPAAPGPDMETASDAPEGTPALPAPESDGAVTVK